MSTLSGYTGLVLSKIFILLAIIFALLLTLFLFMRPSSDTVTLGNTVVQVEVADTPAELAQGLSGRASLDPGQGMLLVFPEEGNHGIWMKDMHFSIDILWASSDGTIITLLESVSPSTYPQSFYPATPTAKYVLELPVGSLKQAGVAVGDKIVVQ